MCCLLFFVVCCPLFVCWLFAVFSLCLCWSSDCCRGFGVVVVDAVVVVIVSDVVAVCCYC